MRYRELPVGTAIAVWIGIFRHEGIVSGFDINGDQLVISNSHRHGKVIEESLSAFARGNSIFRLNLDSEFSGEQVVIRARSQLGAPWDLFRLNCQHFVRWAYGLKPESPQLQLAIAAISIGALTRLFVAK